MIKDRYPLESFQQNQAFLFNSIGTKGIVLKAIVFEYLEENRYNLAFGDYKNGQMDDEIVTNNNDLIKVMSTVAHSLYLFMETYPNALVEIDPVDEKRCRLYNTIFKRRHQEVQLLFDIYGINEYSKEPYNSIQYYQKFEIERKKM